MSDAKYKVPNGNDEDDAKKMKMMKKDDDEKKMKMMRIEALGARCSLDEKCWRVVLNS